jgi:apolipoprotein D and lipocalin family protein
MISGPSTSYLWILSREPRLAPEVLERLSGVAQGLGFDTTALIFVQH